MEAIVQNVRNLIKFVAVVAILVAVYLFAAETNLQRDMTEAKIYSLTERSEQIARSVKTPTTIHFFHTPRQGGGSFNAERLRTLLDQYVSLNEKISFREVDHTRRPNLARKHNVRSNNTVLIKSGDRTTKLTRYDMLKISGRRRRTQKFQGESAISTALMKMSHSTDRKIYVTQGHGEYSRQSSRRAPSVSDWATALEEEGYAVETFNPLMDTLPDTRDLVVIVGPAERYSDGILDGLGEWNARGGNLLIAVGGTTAPAFNNLLEPIGMTFEAYYLIDPSRRVQSLQSLVNPFVFAPEIKSHPAVRAIKEQGLGIQTGRSTSLELTGDTATKLLITSGEAYAKPAEAGKEISASFNPETDEQGTFTVGAVATPADRGKVLVFGSPALFGNSYLQQAPGNEDFAINLVNWVFDRDVSLGIRATPSDYNRVTVTASQAYVLEIIALGLIPLGIIFWGGWVWWNRKNR